MAIKRIDRSEDFESEFVRCLPWLIAAHQHNKDGINFRSIIKGLIERDLLLWVGENAACVTALTEWRDHKVCCLYLIGGNKGKALNDIRMGFDPIREHALQFDCDGLIGIGRSSWARFLIREFGFEIAEQQGEGEGIFYRKL